MDRLRQQSSAGLVGAFVGVLAIYFIVDRVLFTIRFRRRYRDVPSFPRHWAFGNLEIAGKKLDPASERHPDYGMEEIWNDLGRPGAWLLDIAPVSVPIVVVCDPSIAEQIAQPSSFNKYSVPKSDTTKGFKHLIGEESMVSSEGEEWRNLRKRFNKGFAPAHLHTLAPLVVSKTSIFVDRLKDAAKRGETFALKWYSQDLTTDIITTIAIQKDFGAQSCPEGQDAKSPTGFLTALRKLSGLTYKVGQGFNLWYVLDPVRPTKAWYYARIQNRALERLIRERLKDTGDATDKTAAKSIVQLALAGMQPTDKLINNTRDQIKTFLFAGQDTTATAIQWCCYEMSKASHSPRVAAIVEKLRAEHDAVFGSAYFSALSVLDKPEKAEQILGNKLPYTTAFVKEVLRLHPPAGSARRSKWDPKDEPPLTIDIAGKPTRIDGARIYLCHWIVQRSPDVWGPDAAEFNPDRWMDEEYVKKLPAGAWRPFERGPRNCIGQELAMMELKMVLCALARGLVFEKVGLTGRDGEKEIFSSHELTAVPCDGMMMKVSMRGEK